MNDGRKVRSEIRRTTWRWYNWRSPHHLMVAGTVLLREEISELEGHPEIR